MSADSRAGRLDVYFGMLDGLRGIAALVVLFAHACGMITGHNILDRKYLAVYFFFMLSGFVVCSAYDQRLRTGFSLTQFYFLRIIRLYPLVIASAVVATIIFALTDRRFLHGDGTSVAVLMSILGVPWVGAEFGFGLFPLNPPQWSLFFEIIAYIFFGLWVPTASTKNLKIVAGIGFFIYAINSVVYGAIKTPFPLITFGAIGSFLLGVILFRLQNSRTTMVPAIPFWGLSIVIILVCAIPAGLPDIVDVAIVAIIFPIIVLSGAKSQNNNSRILNLLAELSYPVYILHWSVLKACTYIFLSRFGAPVSIALGMSLSIMFSWLMLKYFDAPVRIYLRRNLQAYKLKNQNMLLPKN